MSEKCQRRTVGSAYGEAVSQDGAGACDASSREAAGDMSGQSR